MFDFRPIPPPARPTQIQALSDDDYGRRHGMFRNCAGVRGMDSGRLSPQKIKRAISLVEYSL